MSSRRSFFRRVLGACGALVGIRAAAPAPETFSVGMQEVWKDDTIKSLYDACAWVQAGGSYIPVQVGDIVNTRHVAAVLGGQWKLMETEPADPQDPECHRFYGTMMCIGRGPLDGQMIKIAT